MQPRIKGAVIICFALFLILFIFTSNSYCDMLLKNNNDFKSIPGPTLLYPTTDDIVLAGRDYLEFKWIRNHFVETDYFDFRLYKGYNTTEPNLILKEKIPSDTYPIKVPSALFESNQVYTWVLVQVFISGEKSDRSFSSFKIIKK